MTTIDFDLKCLRCGCELNGTPLDGVCPKCNAAIGTMLDLTAIEPETMTVCQDLSCIGCDYNLRTLAIQSVCPECGRPVADSLHPRLFEFANPQWLRDQRGVALLGIVPFLALAAGVVFGCLGLWFDELSFLFLLLAVVAIISAAVAGTSTLIVGSFVLGWEDGSGLVPMPARRGTRRRGILLGAALCCMALLPFLAGSVVGPTVLTGIPSCVVGVVSLIALNIRAIGLRARGPWLRRMATAWAAVLMAVLVVMLSLMVAAVVRSGSTGSVTWPRIGWPLLGLLGIAAYVLGLLTLAIYYALLSDALKQPGARA